MPGNIYTSFVITLILLCLEGDGYFQQDNADCSQSHSRSIVVSLSYLLISLFIIFMAELTINEFFPTYRLGKLTSSNYLSQINN